MVGKKTLVFVLLLLMSTQALGYTNWDGGEPNDAGDGEDCSEANWNGDRWNDIGCNDNHQGICEYPDGTYDTTSSMDFSAARNECQSRGGHMVVINTASENDYINNNFGNGWLGYYQPSGTSEPYSGWRWVDTNDPPQVNSDGNGDNLPSPASATGTSPARTTSPTLSADIFDSDQEGLNVEFYRDRSTWNEVFNWDRQNDGDTLNNFESIMTQEKLQNMREWDQESGRISWAEVGSGNDNNHGRMKFSKALPSNNGNLRLNLHFGGTSFEASGAAFYVKDSSGDVYNIVCDSDDALTNGYNCPNNYGSPDFQGSYEVSSDGDPFTRFYINSVVDDCCYDGGDSANLYYMEVDVRRENFIGRDTSVDTSGDGEDTATVNWNGLSCGASYNWYVKAIEDDGDASTTSNTWNFNVNCNQPPSVSIVEPAESTNTGLVTTTSPQLKVSVSDSDDSNLDVTFFDGSGNQIGTKNNVYSQVSQEWSGLSKGSTYSWYARVCDDGGACTTSSTATFSVNTPPEKPQGPTPSDVTVEVDYNSVSLSAFVEDKDGDQMDIRFTGSSVSDSFSKTASVSGSGNPTVTVSGLEPGTTYNWEVTAEDEHGSSTTSDTWSFTTDYLPTIENPQPHDGAFISRDSTELSIDVYDQDGDSTNIRIYDESGAQIGSGSTSDGSEVTVNADYTGLSYGNTYQWTVEAEDSLGTNSKTFSFSVIGGGSFRSTSGIEYEYSSVIKSSDQAKYIEYEVMNRNAGSKQLVTSLSGPDASFTQYAGSSHSYTLAGGSTKTFRIQVVEDQRGEYTLEVTTRNRNLGTTNTDTIPVMVRQYPASGVERVPGLMWIQVLFLVAGATVLYSALL